MRTQVKFILPTNELITLVDLLMYTGDVSKLNLTSLVRNYYVFEEVMNRLFWYSGRTFDSYQNIYQSKAVFVSISSNNSLLSNVDPTTSLILKEFCQFDKKFTDLAEDVKTWSITGSKQNEHLSSLFTQQVVVQYPGIGDSPCILLTIICRI